MALASAIVLLFANLDNVPDCPELLNARADSAVCIQLASHPVPALPGILPTAREFIAPLAANDQYSPALLLPIAPSCFIRLPSQAADPSPPGA